MHRAGGLLLAVLITSSGYSQRITRSFGSVVFPGGTSTTSPTTVRNFGSAVFPGGSPTSPVVTGGPSLVVAPRAFQHPGAPGFPFPNGSGVVAAPAINNLNGFGGFNRGFNNSFNNGFQGSGKGGRGNRNNNTFFYPIFVGGGYYGGYGTGSYDPAPFAPELMGPQAFAPAPMPAPGPAQAGPTVVYPSQQQPEGGRTIIELRPDGTYATLRQGAVPAGMPPAYGGDVASQDAQDTSGDAPHFMIAFKDHTVYSAVAYWFEGDILHYFTNGNTHNQASVSLIDRPLTERLNREMGIPFRMPAEK